MHIRRLVKAGESSHTISLPKSWLEKNKLNKGDLVYISEKPNNELAVSVYDSGAKPEKSKEITINIDDKEIDTIKREITSAYVNNYHTINIIGKSLNQKVKDIRKTIHDFVALEISEQTSSKIVAKDLLDLSDISIDKNINRMDMILRSVIIDSISILDGEDHAESIVFRDFDINRLYFLMSRLLKSSSEDIRIAESIKVSNTNILSTWYLTLNIENLADTVKNLALMFKDLSKKDDTDNIRKIYNEIKQAYLNVMKSYYNKDKILADSVALDRIRIFDMCDDYFKKNNSVNAAILAQNFKEMETSINNIARIVIDN